MVMQRRDLFLKLTFTLLRYRRAMAANIARNVSYLLRINECYSIYGVVLLR